MLNKIRTISFICCVTFLSGCATTGGAENHGITGEVLCMIAASAAGAGAGAVYDNEPEIFIPGAVIGGIIGYLACREEEPMAVSRPADSDGDGGTDNNDRCPATPRGTRVN